MFPTKNSSTHPDYKELVATAMAMQQRAYAPYSGFAVGAAVLTRSGRIYPGANIENAAYPATVCAERVAMFNAYAAGDRDIQALAVVTPTDDVASPCGVCRQVMLELAGTCTVILLNQHGDERLTSPQELLPHGFDAGKLGSTDTRD